MGVDHPPPLWNAIVVSNKRTGSTLLPAVDRHPPPTRKHGCVFRQWCFTHSLTLSNNPSQPEILENMGPYNYVGTWTMGQMGIRWTPNPFGTHVYLLAIAQFMPFSFQHWVTILHNGDDAEDSHGVHQIQYPCSSHRDQSSLPNETTNDQNGGALLP